MELYEQRKTTDIYTQTNAWNSPLNQEDFGNTNSAKCKDCKQTTAFISTKSFN